MMTKNNPNKIKPKEVAGDDCPTYADGITPNFNKVKEEEVLGLNRVVLPPYDDGSIRMEISKERGQDDSSLS